jgi:hypothetical protein
MERWNVLKRRLEVSLGDLGVSTARLPDGPEALRDHRHLAAGGLLKVLAGAAGAADRIDEYCATGHAFSAGEPLKADQVNAFLLWLAWSDFVANWRPRSPERW